MPHIIDGKPDLGDGKTFETHSPIDGRLLAKVAAGTAADIDRAAKSSAEAFKTWRKTSGKERRAILHGIADAIVARAEEIAYVECLDTGQAIRFMSKAALRGAENFRFYADRAPDAQNGLSLPTPSHMNYTIRQPIGPVGVITPWNTPFMLSTWKIAPALAAGCTVVHKPAEWSPLDGPDPRRDRARKPGLPAGVWNVVHGYGRERRQGADRASRHQGHRLRRRIRHRQPDHAAGRADPEAGPFRARRQEPGLRVRRCRSRPRARCRDLHDLQPERRALHLVEPGSGPGIDL